MQKRAVKKIVIRFGSAPPLIFRFTVRFTVALALGLAFTLTLFAPTTAHATELRCGWLDNPTPNNAWLHDKHGAWIIAIQGEYEAEGDWPPEFKRGEWVEYGHGGHGYGCVCLKVDVDTKTKKILKIVDGKSRPLSVCRRDRAIAKLEKKWRQRARGS